MPDQKYNCWISENGVLRTVDKGFHMAQQSKACSIRISTPEHRRTWAGVEVLPNATLKARWQCLLIVRRIRAAGLDIIADIDGQIIECMNHDRPTELNRAIREAKLDFV